MVYLSNLMKNQEITVDLLKKIDPKLACRIISSLALREPEFAMEAWGAFGYVIHESADRYLDQANSSYSRSEGHNYPPAMMFAKHIEVPGMEAFLEKSLNHIIDELERAFAEQKKQYEFKEELKDSSETLKPEQLGQLIQVTSSNASNEIHPQKGQTFEDLNDDDWDDDDEFEEVESEDQESRWAIRHEQHIDPRLERVKEDAHGPFHARRVYARNYDRRGWDTGEPNFIKNLPPEEQAEYRFKFQVHALDKLTVQVFASFILAHIVKRDSDYVTRMTHQLLKIEKLYQQSLGLDDLIHERGAPKVIEDDFYGAERLRLRAQEEDERRNTSQIISVGFINLCAYYGHMQLIEEILQMKISSSTFRNMDTSHIDVALFLGGEPHKTFKTSDRSRNKVESLERNIVGVSYAPNQWVDISCLESKNNAYGQDVGFIAATLKSPHKAALTQKIESKIMEGGYPNLEQLMQKQARWMGSMSDLMATHAITLMSLEYDKKNEHYLNRQKKDWEARKTRSKKMTGEPQFESLPKLITHDMMLSILDNLAYGNMERVSLLLKECHKHGFIDHDNPGLPIRSEGGTFNLALIALQYGYTKLAVEWIEKTPKAKGDSNIWLTPMLFSIESDLQLVQAKTNSLTNESGELTQWYRYNGHSSVDFVTETRPEAHTPPSVSNSPVDLTNGTGATVIATILSAASASPAATKPPSRRVTLSPLIISLLQDDLTLARMILKRLPHPNKMFKEAMAREVRDEKWLSLIEKSVLKIELETPAPTVAASKNNEVVSEPRKDGTGRKVLRV